MFTNIGPYLTPETIFHSFANLSVLAVSLCEVRRAVADKSEQTKRGLAFDLALLAVRSRFVDLSVGAT